MTALHSDPSTPPNTTHDFSITRRGVRKAHEWRGRHISIFIEFKDGTDLPCITTTRLVRTALVRTFDAIYQKFVTITQFVPAPMCNRHGVAPTLPIEIPLDNNGAGGLAHHGIGGISVGASLFEATVRRWEEAIRTSHGDISWLPTERSGWTFGSNTPTSASIDQVYLYELNRNFWPPWINRKIDWVCDDDDTCWGWWTVGMNNAMAIILPTVMRMPFYYFGHSFDHFKAGMVEHLKHYRDHVCNNGSCVYSMDDKFAVGWTKSRMVWRSSASVNDLMTGLIVRSFDRFGGEAFVKRLFKAFVEADDINDSDAGQRNYQKARDNIFMMWSYAAQSDLSPVFDDELEWRVSDSAKRTIRRNFSSSSLSTPRFSLSLESI